VIADGQGRAMLTNCQACPGGWSETAATPITPFALICQMGAHPAIPPQRHEPPVAGPDWIYKNRNQVDRIWARLKEWHAIATG